MSHLTRMSDLHRLDKHPSTLLSSNGHGAMRMVVVAMAALLVIGGALAWRIGVSSSNDPNQLAKLAMPQGNPVLDRLVDTTRALESSQQQAVDQLQVMQDMLSSQQTETKKASDRVALLSGKLDALQQSFASIPPAIADDPVMPPRQKAVSRTTSRIKAHHRLAPKRTARAKKQRTASRK